MSRKRRVLIFAIAMCIYAELGILLERVTQEPAYFALYGFVAGAAITIIMAFTYEGGGGGPYAGW